MNGPRRTQWRRGRSDFLTRPTDVVVGLIQLIGVHLIGLQALPRHDSSFFCRSHQRLGISPINPRSQKGLPQDQVVESCCCCCWLLACLTSQHHSSVSQGLICSDNCTCCHTEPAALADQTCYLTKSQYVDTRPTSPVLTL